MFDAEGHRLKLVVFTEHRDTLNYLAEQIRKILGRPEALVTIHGALGREERRKAQESFTQDKEVQILVATDAAGEGINLQRAHLMVNYDLPWNPNRLEQRFGRIHRIGQTEVCHLWNLVAEETREGDVFVRLFEKLEEQRRTLGGGVFDILGKMFRDQPLRQLLIEAIRYGNRPEVRARLFTIVDNLADQERCRELLEERALARDSMSASKVREIREQMERAEARRLQPHFISSFFLEAFRLLGGSIHEREQKRYEISHVPAVIRNRDRIIGTGEAVLSRYERITFERELINPMGQALAAFICPGHPLLDATIDLILERYRDLLKRGATLIAPNDLSEDIRALFYLEHSIQDARTDHSGNRRVVSRRMQFVEIDASGNVRNAGYAPYLDYRATTPEEKALTAPLLEPDWLKKDLETKVLEYAVQSLVPQHFSEVKTRKEELVEKTMGAVKERLTKEITYWDHRAEELKAQELAGRTPRLNSGKARQRADDLQARLQKRLEELEQERRLSPMPPVVIGGALVVPAGLMARLRGERKGEPTQFAKDRERVMLLAMAAVIEAERHLGFSPRDVSAQNLGYDIESEVRRDGRLRFIEVKGRAKGADTVTITKNEILTALNKPEDFILALVEVDGDSTTTRYVRQPFQREPDFGVTSVNYDLKDLATRASEPA